VQKAERRNVILADNVRFLSPAYVIKVVQLESTTC